MTTTEPAKERPVAHTVKPKRAFGVGWTVAIVMVILTIVSGILVVRFLLSTPERLLSKAIEKQESVIDITSVVTSVKELSRLETAAMEVTHIATITQSYGVVPDVLTGDELTLFAVGEVIGGIDLSQLTEDDVWVDGDVLVLRLPHPQILVSRIDNEKTRVVDRKTGILRKGDIHLESRARADAEVGIRKEAMKRGILEESAESAEVKMADFLRALGVERVRFESGEVMNPFREH